MGGLDGWALHDAGSAPISTIGFDRVRCDVIEAVVRLLDGVISGLPLLSRRMRRWDWIVWGLSVMFATLVEWLVFPK